MNTTPQIETLLTQGRYVEARYLAETQAASVKDSKSIQQLGLALSKSGLPEEAVKILEPLHRADPDDPETAGILGSVYKELFKRNQQTSFALLSRDTYLKNYTATGNYYTGINAAAMSAMIMQGSQSKEIARKIISSIDPGSTNFWELATLGEAYFLTKDTTHAIDFYVKARKAANNDWGKIGSVHNQLWLLNHFLPVNREILKIFNPPGIVTFVGHMIDHPSRKEPRFPASIEPQIKNAIASSLRTLNAHIGFCSLACGGDLLFAEVMAEAGAELNLYLPFAVPDFLEVSVGFAGQQWVDRFKSIIQRYPVSMITEEGYGSMNQLFEFQSKVVFGSSILRSMGQQNKTSLLTVLSETDLKQKIGGTYSSIHLWPSKDNHININPDVFVDRTSVAIRSEVFPPASKEIPDRELRTLIIVNVCPAIPTSREKILKDLGQFDFASAKFTLTEIDSTTLLYAFESEVSAFDLMRHIHVFAKSLPGPHISMALHSGLVHRNGSKLDGENVETCLELNKLNVDGGILVSDPVACLLALHLKLYSLTSVGTIVSNAKKMSLYRVGIL